MLGLEKGLNISWYANKDFNSNQMWFIRLGLESNVDVSIYADLKYNENQMLQILYGLEKNQMLVGMLIPNLSILKWNK